MILFLYFLAFCLFGYSLYKLYWIVALAKALNKKEKQLIVDIQESLKHIAKDVDLQKGLDDSRAVQDYLSLKTKDLNKKILTNERLDEKSRLSLMMAFMQAATHIVMVKTINRKEFKTEDEIKKEVEETIDIFSLPSISNNKFELALYGTLFLSSFYMLFRYFSLAYMYVKHIF